MDKLDVISALDALAQESRLDIFRFLVRKGESGAMVGTIGEALELPHATLSFHLEKLKSSGLVVCEKQGRANICRANFKVLVGAMEYLTEKCCEGSGLSCEITFKSKKECK